MGKGTPLSLELTSEPSKPITCDHCGKPMQSAFPAALCPPCYAAHSDKLMAELRRESALDWSLWSYRRSLPVNDWQADQRFLAEVKDRKTYEEWLRAWKQASERATSKRQREPGK